MEMGTDGFGPQGLFAWLPDISHWLLIRRKWNSGGVAAGPQLSNLNSFFFAVGETSRSRPRYRHFLYTHRN
jgi:hypothetical protein